MGSIKIYMIPWLLATMMCIHLCYGGLCQQQAESAFQLISLGNNKNKQECYDKCCQKKGCHVSLVAGKRCFGIHCAQSDLCKAVTEQLSDFEGHRVDKRSIDNTLLDSNLPSDLFNRYVKDDDNDDNGEGSDDANENDDNDDKKNTCSKGKFKNSVIPKRKKSYKFKKLHSKVKHLSDCSKHCCKTDACVLAFTLEDDCYGVMCSSEKNCHAKKDKLPRTKISVTTVHKKDSSKKHKKKSKKKSHKHDRKIKYKDGQQNFESVGNIEKNQDYRFGPNLVDNYKNSNNQLNDVSNENREVNSKPYDEGQEDELEIGEQRYDQSNSDQFHDDVHMLNYYKDKNAPIDDEQLAVSHLLEESVGATLSGTFDERNGIPTSSGYRHSSTAHHYGLTTQRSSKAMLNSGDLMSEDDKLYPKPTSHYKGEDLYGRGYYTEKPSKKYSTHHSTKKLVHTTRGTTKKVKHTEKEKKNKKEKVKENEEELLLQRIENLEKKLNAKQKSLSPEEKKKQKMIKKLELLESKKKKVENHVNPMLNDEQGSGSGGEQNYGMNTTDSKAILEKHGKEILTRTDEDKKKTEVKKHKEETIEGSGSGATDEKDNQTISKQHDIKSGHEENIEEVGSGSITNINHDETFSSLKPNEPEEETGSGVLMKNTKKDRKISKLPHNEKKSIVTKHKQMKHSHVKIENKKRKIESVHNHTVVDKHHQKLKANHSSKTTISLRDHIDKPKKHSKTKESRFYGHKEDIFKEFEKFREMYEGSGFDHHIDKNKERKIESLIIGSDAEKEQLHPRKKGDNLKKKKHPSSVITTTISPTTTTGKPTTTTTKPTTTTRRPTTSTTRPTTTTANLTTTSTITTTFQIKTTPIPVKAYAKSLYLPTSKPTRKIIHHTKPLPDEHTMKKDPLPTKSVPKHKTTKIKRTAHKIKKVTTKANVIKVKPVPTVAVPTTKKMKTVPTVAVPTTKKMKTVPTVAVDGLNNKAPKTSSKIINKPNILHKELTIKDVSHQLVHRGQNKHKVVPSLNIDIGDDDLKPIGDKHLNNNNDNNNNNNNKPSNNNNSLKNIQLPLFSIPKIKVRADTPLEHHKVTAPPLTIKKLRTTSIPVFNANQQSSSLVTPIPHQQLQHIMWKPTLKQQFIPSVGLLPSIQVGNVNHNILPHENMLHARPTMAAKKHVTQNRMINRVPLLNGIKRLPTFPPVLNGIHHFPMNPAKTATQESNKHLSFDPSNLDNKMNPLDTDNNMPENIGELKFDHQTKTGSIIAIAMPTHVTPHDTESLLQPVKTKTVSMHKPTSKEIEIQNKPTGKLVQFHNKPVLHHPTPIIKETNRKVNPTAKANLKPLTLSPHGSMQNKTIGQNNLIGKPSLKDNQIVSHKVQQKQPSAKTTVVPMKKQTATRKESPIEVVNRLLGHHKKGNKSISRLDDFFTANANNEKNTEKNPNAENNFVKKPNELVNKSKPVKQKLDDLENFFKKAEIKHPPAKKFTNNGSNTSTIKHVVQFRNEKLKTIKDCGVVKDIQSMVFAMENVLEVSRVPTMVNNMEACFEKCCNHKFCHVASLEDQVCKLFQCGNKTLCKSLLPTKRNIRLVFNNKPTVLQNVGSAKYCDKQHAVGVMWEKTKAGSSAVINCPREASGHAKRFCDEHLHWLQPDFSNCISQDYSHLQSKVQGLGHTGSAKSLANELDDVTTQSIDNSLIFGGDLKKASETIFGITNFLTKSQIEEFGHKDLRSITRSVSNLFDVTNKQEWSNLRQTFGPTKLIDSLDSVSLYVAKKLAKSMEMKPVVTRSIILSVAKMAPHSQKVKYSFPNYSIPVLNGWSTRKDSIVIPHTVFSKDTPTLVASMNFKTLGYLLPHRWNTKKHVTFTDGFFVNSNVISSSLNPKPAKHIDPPVTIVLHHLKEMNAVETKCVFWDFNKSSNTGSWSTEGCWLVSSNKTTSICQCNHLTHFAVLSNSNDKKVSAKEQAKEHTMAAVWLGVPLSIVFLVGAMYSCFAWSKVPRRRHVVIMDKKPVLPDDEVIVTQTVSEKYPGSPDRYLYAANCTPSPSELEWEHAWDFLTNSDFDVINKKGLHTQIKKELLKQKLLLKEKQIRRMTQQPAPTNASSSSTDSQGEYYHWKHQDDFEWSKERIKCLGRGLLDISPELTQPVPQQKYRITDNDDATTFDDGDATALDNGDTTTFGNGDTTAFDNGDTTTFDNTEDTFSPVAFSSPHSISFEEAYVSKTRSLHRGVSYLKISFDPEVDEVDSNESTYQEDKGSEPCDDNQQSHNNINETCENIQETRSNISYENNTETENKEIYEIEIVKDIKGTSLPVPYFTDDICDIYEDSLKSNVIDIILVDLNSAGRERLESPDKIIDSHIFNISLFNTSTCADDCCITGINLLFDEGDEDVSSRMFLDIMHTDINVDEGSNCSKNEHFVAISLQQKELFHEPTDILHHSSELPYKPIELLYKPPELLHAKDNQSKPKKMTSFTSARVAKHIRKSLLHRTSMVRTPIQINTHQAMKKLQKEKQSSTYGSNMRTQTPHMKSYIALRQQCRMNDSQLTSQPKKTNKTKKVKSHKPQNSVKACDASLNQSKNEESLIHANIESSESSLQKATLESDCVSIHSVKVKDRSRYISRTLKFKAKQTNKQIKRMINGVRSSYADVNTYHETQEDRKVVCLNKKLYQERKAFTGHLRRWHCEEFQIDLK